MKPNTVGRVGGPDPQPHPLHPAAPTSGVASGTMVLTQDGEMPVEFLSPGDRIITRGTGFVRLVAVHRTLCMVRAISFAAGSLGHTRPETDLTLPAGQQVLVRDWRAQALFGQPQAAAEAETLIDGEFILDLGPRPMLLHQMRFEHPQVVYAGGLELVCPAAAMAQRLGAKLVSAA